MKTDFIKIRVFLPLAQNDIILRNDDGSFIGSQDFVELRQEADIKFREPIITFLNDEIGVHNWAIKFIQFDVSGEWFDARLYCEDQKTARKMISVILNRIPNIKFNWLYCGNIFNYFERK